MPTWNSDRQQRGFTLLELMMVLLLIGLLAGAGLTLDFAGSASSQQQQAEMLAQQFKLASQEAVQSGNLWALDFFRLPLAQGQSQSGYRWLFHDGKRWQEAEPAMLDAKAGTTLLPAAIQLRLSLDGSVLEPELRQALITASGAANSRFAPEIVLSSTREFSAFTAQLCSSEDKTCGAEVSVDALGRVVVQADHAAR